MIQNFIPLGDGDKRGGGGCVLGFKPSWAGMRCDGIGWDCEAVDRAGV